MNLAKIICIVFIIFWWIFTITFTIIDKDLKYYLILPLIMTLLALLVEIFN